MAKHCTVCNQTYSDDLTACPHCAGASGVRLASGPPSSGIAVGPASDPRQRVTDSGTWSPLIDGPTSSVSGSQHGSEVDLGPQFTRGKRPPQNPNAAGDEDGSGVDLGTTPPPPSTGSASRSNGSRTGQSGSYVESSAVDLGAPPRGRSPLSSGLRLSDLGAEPVEPSSDKLREIPLDSDSGSSDDLDAFIEEGSHVDLGTPGAKTDDRPSKRDLIAEAVESGTDLLGTGSAAAELVPAEEIRFARPHRQEEAGEDEMVDLGAPRPEEDLTALSQISKNRWEDPSSGSMVRLDAAGPRSAVSGDAVDLEASASTVPELALGDDDSALVARKAVRREVVAEAHAGILTPAIKRAWVRGGAAGALVGGVACFLLLWLTGLVQFSKQNPKETQPSVPSSNAVVEARPPAPTVLPTAGPVETGKQHLRAYLAARSPQERGLDRNHAAVRQSIDAFTQANNAEGLYWLGLLDELSLNEGDARAKYEKGWNDYRDDPRQARIFQAALQRLASRPSQAGTNAARAAHFQTEDFPEPFAALLLVTLQGEPQPTDVDEAGFKFWEAAAKAKNGDFAGGLAALREARQLHERRRLQNNSFNGINPTSDPLEEIFVRSCEQIEAYWQMQQSLRQYGYDSVATLADARQQEGKGLDIVAGKLKIAAKRPAARTRADLAKLGNWLKLVETEVDGAIKARGANDDVVKRLAAVTAKSESPAVKAILGDARADTPDAVLDALLAKLGTITDQLKAAGAETATLKERHEAVANKLAAAKIPGVSDAKDPAAAVERLAAAYHAITKTVQTIGDKLKVTGEPNQTALVQALDGVISVAQSKDAGGQIRSLQTQLQQQQNEWRSPKAMIDLWLRLARDGKLDAWLPSGEADRRLLLDQMAKDAEHVASATDVSAEEQAKALCVQGLVRSQQGDYPGARQSLQAALQDKPASGWRTVAAQSLKDLTDPQAYCLPWAETLYQTGQHEAALKHLNQALAAFPNNGALLALRSLAAHDLAAKLPPGDARTAEHRKQAGIAAQAAIAAGAVAEGHYAAGRLAESEQRWAEAERHYRQALDARSDGPRTATTYRKALARVLLAQGGVRPATVLNDRPLLPASETPATVAVLNLLTLLQDANDVPQDAGKLRDARALAEQIIRDGDNEGYFLLAQAYRGENLMTQALTAYAEGFVRLSRDGSLGLRPEYATTLQEIVREHPAFQRPTSLAHAEPLQAEERFGAGLRLYNAGRYADAESAFGEAYQYDSKDARFLYFLGLSRIPQGKWAAALEDFRLGADLERQGRPGAALINASLERVQGNARQTVNQYRP